MEPLHPPMSPQTPTLGYATPVGTVGSRARRWAAMELQVWSLLLAGLGFIAGMFVLSLFLIIGQKAGGKRWVSLEQPALALGLAGVVVGTLWFWAGAYWSCGRAIRQDGRRAAGVALVMVGLHLLAALVILASPCWCLLTGHAIVDVFDSVVMNTVAGTSLFLIILAGNASLAHLLWCLMRIVRRGAAPQHAAE